MNNEPVALMTEYGIKPLYEGALQEGMFLYSHPKKEYFEDEPQAEELHEILQSNSEPVALTQGDILGILQDANSVPCGQPIFNSSEEYNKLKAIIESAIRYTHPAKTLTDEEIRTAKDELNIQDDKYSWDFPYMDFAKAILRKAQEK